MEALDKITFLVGDKQTVVQMTGTPAKVPFAHDICEFLDAVSKALMSSAAGRQYPDVVTFGFWIRKASVQRLKKRFQKDGHTIRLGRGIAFHVAPSNVPVNFAYSLAAGLLAGNANIVRVPSRDFIQMGIIVDAIKTALEAHQEMKPYIALIRYDRDKDVNDCLSSISDIRIIWGGDTTIAEIRKSPLPPRGTEVTFADRYSIAVIDSNQYLEMENKGRIAEDFYNDTYMNDQNACTSPNIVIWTGNQREDAKAEFWENLHKLVKQKYKYQDIQGVDKLTYEYLASVAIDGLQVLPHEDNLLIRVKTSEAAKRLMDFRGNSGYFFEYDCEDVMELFDICNDKRCQTVGVLGDKEFLVPLIQKGIRGIDRVVEIGKTMDFDLVWDGYDLVGQMSRIVAL